MNRVKGVGIPGGTTPVLFEPLDFIARLAALVPKPRVKLMRYHGVFAPNSAQRAQATKGGRGKGARSLPINGSGVDKLERSQRPFTTDLPSCRWPG